MSVPRHLLPLASIALLALALGLLAPTGCTDGDGAPKTGSAGSAPKARSPWLDDAPKVPLFVDDPAVAGPDDLEPPMRDDPALGGADDGADEDEGMTIEHARQRGGKVAADPLGGCRVDLEKGRVVIDAVTLFREGPFLELFACTDRGKTHESLLMAFVAPDKLHLALLALGLEPVAEVAHFGEQRALDKAPRLGITLEWTGADGETHRRMAEDVLLDRYRRESMPRVGWAFSGSRFVTIPAGYDGPTERRIYAGIYMGSILTVYHDPDSVIDNPLATGGDDQTYLPYAERLPKAYTDCRLVFEKWDAKLHGPEADPQARGALDVPPVEMKKARFPSIAPAAVGGPIGAASAALRRKR